MTEEQFKDLYNYHYEDIRRYLYYRSGEVNISTDLAQETFMRIWEKQLELQPGKDTGLLYKIASDLYVSYIRREIRFDGITKELRLTYETSTPEDELNYNELRSNYEKALVKLPEKFRTVFLMSRMDDLTYSEIARRLSLSVKAVEKRMTKALEKLRMELHQ